MKNDLTPLLRKHYLEMTGYTSARMTTAQTPDTVFLNANENPYELPGLEGLSRYPDAQPAELREALAQTYNVAPEEIVMTRGADEAINTLIKLFCEPRRDAILTCPPTFGIYRVDATAMPAETIEIPLIRENGTFTLDAETIVKTALNPEHNIKLVFLCAPNNPTGTNVPHETILEICETLKTRAAVVLDETYAEFAENGSLCDAKTPRPGNLIILRTLSKSYALAGIRLGCLIAQDTDFTALVRAKGIDIYPLPRPTIDAALRALSPEIKPIAHENIGKILAERERIIPLLKTCPTVRHVYPSDANFLLVEIENASAFCALAAKDGILLRDFSADPLTPGCLRITVGTPQQNDRVIALLKNFVPRES